LRLQNQAIMKKFILLSCLLSSFGVFAQRSQFSAFLNSDIPNRAIMPKMSNSFGIGLSYGIRPIQNFPLYFELKGNIASYADKTLQQTYEFTNGDITNVDINYKSAINKVLLGAKISTGHDLSTFRVFAKPQFGSVTMKSKIRIADPEDEDDCRPLEKKTTQRYNGFVYGGEIGFELSLNQLFRNFKGDEQHRLIISADYLLGINPFEYVNVNYMQSGEVDHSNHVTTDGTREITGEFKNMTTQNVHEHKIAELYLTKFNMWGINVGYVFNF